MKKPAVPPAVPELDLLLDWDRSSVGRSRLKETALISAGLHIAGLILLLVISPLHHRPEDSFVGRFRESAHLIAPAPILTQRPANRKTPRREVNLESLLAKRTVAAPKPAISEPAPIPPAPVLNPPATQPPVTAPPVNEPSPAPPPAPAPQEKPKLAFENPGAETPPSRPPSGVFRQPGNAPTIRLPGSSVEDAIQEVARSRRGSGTVVGGDMTEDVSGILETRGINPTTHSAASTVELLSDPKGVDFKPYLTRILTAVRRNWRAVFPESARLGRRGRVVILFSIARSGEIPKLVISEPSGADALDRAAVAGISASDPFPPLPSEYTGDEIRLQLNFSYNMRQ